MNEDAEVILSFLRSLGRTLWLQGLLNRLLYAACLGGFMLLAMGACNRFYRPIPLFAGLLFVILPQVFALAMSLMKPPPDAEGVAAVADRLFDGKSLLTTAVGVIKSEAESPLAAYTIHKAALAAKEWSGRLHEIPKQAKAPWHWPAAGMALAGLFLLMLPAVPIQSPGEDAHFSEGNAGQTAADFMAQITSPSKPPAKPESPMNQDAHRSEGGEFTAGAFTQAQAAEPPSTRDKPLRGQSVKAAGSSSSQGEGAGDMADLSSPGKPSFRDEGLKNTRRVDIARHGGSPGEGEALSPDRGSPFDSPPPAVHWHPASAAIGGAGNLRLSIAQRHYLAAYFRLIETP